MLASHNFSNVLAPINLNQTFTDGHSYISQLQSQSNEQIYLYKLPF